MIKKLVRSKKIYITWNKQDCIFFNSEINQRNLCSKKLSKNVSAFDYIDKTLIVLNATTEGVCIISHSTVVGAPLGIACAGFTVVFSLATGIIIKILKAIRNKKNHDKILVLAKSKLISIETLVTDWHEKKSCRIWKRKRNMRRWKKIWEIPLRN